MTAYPKSEQQIKDLENRFTYHAPKGDQTDRYVKLREKYKELAHMIVDLTPTGREQATALTNLETSSFWANASIARGE